MKNSELSGKKWSKFLRRVRLFRFVPFVEFVLAAGSLATGNLHENSDFDVILGVRRGRIFTTRFFSVMLFGSLGLRRKKMTHGEEASDKICLSHFVTSKAYRLSPPYNDYWQNLYYNLVPVLGSDEKVNDFFKANNWLKPERAYKSNPFHLSIKDSPVRSFLEKALGGGLGNWLERVLKNLQVRKIKRSLDVVEGYKPRVIYTDDELEFHPDTRRIEEMLKNKTIKVAKRS